MNTNELHEDIKDHKNRLGDVYSEVTELVIPFFMLHQKLFEAACKIQEEKYKLSNSEVDVLITALVSGDENYIISPTKLYHKLLFTTGAITKVLKKLEYKKYIIRIDNEHDKRSKLLQLTPKGISTTKEVFKDVMNFQEKVFSALTKREQDIFENSLIKIYKRMRK